VFNNPNGVIEAKVEIVDGCVPIPKVAIGVVPKTAGEPPIEKVEIGVAVGACVAVGAARAV